MTEHILGYFWLVATKSEKLLLMKIPNFQLKEDLIAEWNYNNGQLHHAFTQFKIQISLRKMIKFSIKEFFSKWGNIRKEKPLSSLKTSRKYVSKQDINIRKQQNTSKTTSLSHVKTTTQHFKQQLNLTQQWLSEVKEKKNMNLTIIWTIKLINWRKW